MEINIYGKEDCAKCEEAKKTLTTVLTKKKLKKKVPFKYFDMDTVDGMAEGAFNDVLKIPTVIIKDSENNIVRWDGTVPETDEILKLFKS